MNKITQYSFIVGAIFLIAGCSIHQNPNHQGVNWGSGACPAPSENQKDSRGYLEIEDGVTLKCQIRPYVSNMACQSITDQANADGIICTNGQRRSVIFLFDENGILTQHQWLN